jgi:tRNA threonylcarbamoyladenosine biosynthesis protein TsaB
MKILAIEMSGAGGSVALALGDVFTERDVTETRDQTARVLPLIDELLVAADLGVGDLDAIAFGQGPGSFTGLRVAAAVAQGLALASGVPIVPVSSMAGLQQQVWRRHAVDSALICIDARMDEVYWAHYRIDANLARCVGDETIGLPATVVTPTVPFTCVGDGFDRYAADLAATTGAAAAVLGGIKPAARDLVPLAVAYVASGQHVAPTAALPTYLRDASAWQRR